MENIPRSEEPGLLQMARRLVPGYSGEAVDDRLAAQLQQANPPQAVQNPPHYDPQQTPQQPSAPAPEGAQKVDPKGLLGLLISAMSIKSGIPDYLNR